MVLGNMEDNDMRRVGLCRRDLRYARSDWRDRHPVSRLTAHNETMRDRLSAI